MQITTGVDILKISRIENSLKNPNFLTRVFGPREVQDYEIHQKIESLAGNYCAKEAFSKALGTGVRKFSLNEVEVLRDSLGKPFFVFSGRAKDIVKAQGLSFSVSISHEADYAVAFVVAWKTQGQNNV